MLPVVDKPVIQYLVEEAVASGIEEIIFVTGRGKRAIEDHFDVAYELEKTLVEKNKIDFLKEVQKIAKLARFSYVRQPYPLGDGHAILQARHLIGDEPVLVLFGDCIYDADIPASKQLITAFEKSHTSIIGTAEVSDEEVSNFGVIEGKKDGDNIILTKILEKPSAQETDSRHVAVGKYIITPEIFTILETMKEGASGEIRLADAFEIALKENIEVRAHALDGVWLDTGDKLNFVKATIHLGLKHEKIAGGLRTYLEELGIGK
jgi:UTP--glucose-1-phosphate uridylyltransferase